MQHFLERKALLERKFTNSSRGTSNRAVQVLSIGFCIVLAAYIALVFLPTLSEEVVGEGRGGHRSGNTIIPGKAGVNGATGTNSDGALSSSSGHAGSNTGSDGAGDGVGNMPDPQDHAGSASGHNSNNNAVVEQDTVVHVGSPSAVAGAVARPMILELPPWGYNRDRNTPRWRAIYASIAADQRRMVLPNGQPRHFTLVDYGADQGYFSISVAKFFPQALVMGLEMGGVGGEIWKRNKRRDGKDVIDADVLAVQEGKIAELGVKNMLICQTKVEPGHFFALNGQRLISDYQLVLSVFHWFRLPDRAAFERTVTALFRNARTTFIELPTMGDGSALIRKQVGWEFFSKWYDNRNDIAEILSAAAKNQGLQVRVTRVIGVRWIRWEREVFRVDVIPSSASLSSSSPADAPTRPVDGSFDKEGFGCAARQKIYGCNLSRALHNKCPI